MHLLPNTRFWRATIEAISVLVLVVPLGLVALAAYNNFIGVERPSATGQGATIAALSADSVSHGLTTLLCVVPGSDDIEGTVLVSTSSDYVNVELPGDAGSTTSLGAFAPVVDASAAPSECTKDPAVRKAIADFLSKEPDNATSKLLGAAKPHAGCTLITEFFASARNGLDKCPGVSQCSQIGSVYQCRVPAFCDVSQRTPCPTPTSCNPLYIGCPTPTRCNPLYSRCPTPSRCTPLAGQCATPNANPRASPSAIPPTPIPSPSPIPSAVSDAVAFGYNYTVPPSHPSIVWPFSFKWHGVQHLTFTERFLRLAFADNTAACSKPSDDSPCLHEPLNYQTPAEVRIFLPVSAVPTTWPSDAQVRSGSAPGETELVVRGGLVDGSSLEVHWIDRNASSASSLGILIVGVLLGIFGGMLTSWVFGPPRWAPWLKSAILRSNPTAGSETPPDVTPEPSALSTKRAPARRAPKAGSGPRRQRKPRRT